MKNTTYYVLYSNGSRYAGGLRPQVSWTDWNRIITAAAYEMAPSGTELEDLAGVEWVEDENGDLNPARELTETEGLNLSIEQLASRGRLYQIWPMTPEGAEAFIETADFYHVGDKARAEVARWRNPE